MNKIRSAEKRDGEYKTKSPSGQNACTQSFNSGDLVLGGVHSDAAPQL